LFFLYFREKLKENKVDEFKTFLKGKKYVFDSLQESFNHKISDAASAIVSLIEHKQISEEHKQSFPIKQTKSFPFIKKNEEIAKENNCLIDLSDNKNNDVLNLIDFGYKDQKQASPPPKSDKNGFSFINKNKDNAIAPEKVNSLSDSKTKSNFHKILDLDKLYAENKENNAKYNFNVNTINYHQNSYISVADLASNNYNKQDQRNPKEERNQFQFIDEFVKKKF